MHSVLSPSHYLWMDLATSSLYLPCSFFFYPKSDGGGYRNPTQYSTLVSLLFLFLSTPRNVRSCFATCFYVGVINAPDSSAVFQVFGPAPAVKRPCSSGDGWEARTSRTESCNVTFSVPRAVPNARIRALRSCSTKALREEASWEHRLPSYCIASLRSNRHHPMSGTSSKLFQHFCEWPILCTTEYLRRMWGVRKEVNS